MEYTPNEEATAAALLAFMSVFGVLFFLIFAITYIISSLFLSFIFKKAGEDMWKAWVPFYNTWVLFEIGGYQGWAGLAVTIGSSVLSSIPFIGWILAIALYVVSILVSLNIQKAFNKTTPFILLYIFVPIVWLAIIGFDSSQYDKTKLGKAIPEFLGKK